MSKSSKEQYPTIVTPPGIALWPRLNTPETEVNGKELETPRYKVTLRLDESTPGVAKFKATLEKAHAEAIAAAEKARKADPKRKNKPLSVNEVIKPALDEDGNEIEGSFDITARTQAVRKDGSEKKVPMFDAQGNKADAKIGSGSKLRLSLAYAPHDTNLGAGLSLYLNAVKIIDLVEYSGGGTAEGYGFGDEDEGSFTAEGSEFDNADKDDEPQGEDAPAEEAPKSSKKTTGAKPNRSRGDF